jgi:hypothetical protein
MEISMLRALYCIKGARMIYRTDELDNQTQVVR